MSWEIQSQAKTDTGLVRSNNEDNYLVWRELGLFAVCDGLGGHAAGEVASELAIETLRQRMTAPSSLPPEHQLLDAARAANERILQDQFDHPERKGMGTTLSALWIPPGATESGWIVHVGDSRIYRFRQDYLDQLTDDHSPLFRLYRQGSLGKEDLRHHPQKNLIERSLGLSAELECDVFPIDLSEEDLFILCTDGVSDCVGDEEIEYLCRQLDWTELCENLIQRALQAGGYDNITAIVARL